MGALSLGLGYIGWSDDPGGSWQTMVFTTMVLAQMGNALALRSNRDSLFQIGVFSNRLMVYSVLLTLGLQLALIYIPFFQNIFKTQPLTVTQFAVCLVTSTLLFVIIEIYKWVRRRT